MLLTPKATSSYSQVREKTCPLINITWDFYLSVVNVSIVTYLISIYGVIVFYRVDFCHGEGHGKTHYSHRKSFNCRLLEDVQVWSHWMLIPEIVQVGAVGLMYSILLVLSTESLIWPLPRTIISQTTSLWLWIIMLISKMVLKGFLFFFNNVKRSENLYLAQFTYMAERENSMFCHWHMFLDLQVLIDDTSVCLLSQMSNTQLYKTIDKCCISPGGCRLTDTQKYCYYRPSLSFHSEWPGPCSDGLWLGHNKLISIFTNLVVNNWEAESDCY